MPALATQHTPAGAVAFAKFFIQTIDWGFATTNSAYMRHFYASSCAECVSHADGIDRTKNAGDHYLGGRFTINSARLASSVVKDAALTVAVTFNLSSTEVVDAKNKFVNGGPAVRGEQRRLGMAWSDDDWIVVDMRPMP